MAFDTSVGSLASQATIPLGDGPTGEAVETPEPEQEADTEDDGHFGRAEGESVKDFLVKQLDDINLARNYSQAVLDKLGMLVNFEFGIDENSRADWQDKADKAMKFATQEAEEKQYPFPKASNVIFPLITQAAVQFNARTYPAIIQNRNVVKGTVWGSDKGTPATVDGKPDGQPQMHPDGTPVWLSAPGDKRKRADRVGEHMSWQLLEEMKEWEAQTDTLLMQLPIIGGAVRKTYRDPSESKNRSLLVSLKNLVWNYNAPSFEDAPRHTEIIKLYPHQIEEYERAEMFLPQVYGPGDVETLRSGGTGDGGNGGDQGDESAPHYFLEQHRRYDLDEDGYPEPYVVTIHKRSSKVVRIVARYDEDSIIMGEGLDVDEDDENAEGEQQEDLEQQDEILKVLPVDHYTLIPFLPNPDGGSYPVGFGHLLRPLNEGINTTLNQMFDAGHLQNAGGGFVSDQLSIASGPVSFQVGKYVRVGSKGQAIRDAVFPIPFPGPSPVLFQLLGVLMNAGKEVASIQDVLAGDAQIANAPPTTILALIEQGMKVYTAIHKRVYRALKSEFDKLYRLNRLYLTDNQRYRVGDEWREVTPEDYKLGGGVEPIADPTMITDMQRLGRAQILMGFKGDPLINQQEIYRRLFDAANIDRIDELFAPPPSPQQQQIQQTMIQVALEEKQAELGRTRAAEAKDQTQAFLNLALARAKASEPEVAWINAQLDVLRLHIEATNTQVRAYEVQGKHHIDTRKVVEDAKRNAAETPTARSAPAPDEGTGIPAVASPIDNGGLPALPGGPAVGLPGGGG